MIDPDPERGEAGDDEQYQRQPHAPWAHLRRGLRLDLFLGLAGGCAPRRRAGGHRLSCQRMCSILLENQLVFFTHQFGQRYRLRAVQIAIRPVNRWMIRLHICWLGIVVMCIAHGILG